MKRLRFQTRINIAFTLLLLTLLNGGFALYRNFDLNMQIEASFKHTLFVLNAIGEIEDHVSRINHWVNHHNDSDFQGKSIFRNETIYNDSLVLNAIKTIRNNYLGPVKDLDSLQTSYNSYKMFMEHIFDLQKNKDSLTANLLLEQYEIKKMNLVLDQVETISKFSQNKANTLYLNMVGKSKDRINYFWFIIIFLIGLGLFLAYALSRSITEPINRFIKEVKAIYRGETISEQHDLLKTSEEEILSITAKELKDNYQKLNQFNTTLEAKVKARTKALKQSEEKFKSLFEKSKDALLILKNDVFIDCNETAINLLGFTSKEAFLNKHPSEISPKTQPNGRDSFDYAQEKIMACFKEGSQHFEWIHKKANGQEFPAEVLLTTIVNEPNSPVIYCVMRDITQRKMVESALLSAKEKAENSEEFLNNIINKMIDPVFVKDDKSRLLVVNEAFCKMFEMTADDILGKTLAEDVSENERDQFLKIDRQVIESGEDNISEETLTIKKKPTFTILTRKSRFVNEQGKKFLVGIITDISLRKKNETELLKSKEKAEESERLKSAFLANMSHEIRTPMNAILGFSNLLNDKKLDATKRSKFIKLINDSGNRLLHIISDIIDVSKINAKQLNIQLKPCNLNELINNLYYQFSIQIKNAELKLDTFKALDDDACYIKTDSLRLFQVLSNLIENALKFTQKGLVRFGYTIQSDMVQFFIEDSGIGIEEQSKDIIFERFHQGNNQSLKSGKGNGLGLAISKGIVELLGGTIWLENTSDKGSTFMFTIPFNPVYNDDFQMVEPQKPHKIREKNHKTILIVEDEVTNFIYLREVLKVFNFKIIHVPNGLEAVEQFTKHKNDIDLVFMDIKMPIMDGYEATINIRKLNSTIPIIAITAYAMEEDETKAMKAGCNHYLSKPVSKQNLYDTILNYLAVNVEDNLV